MRTVDITTSQKVTIRYELAELRDRVVAWIIDFVIVLATYLILIAVIQGTFDPFTIWPYVIALLVPVFYNLYFEVRLNGQTPGKKVLGLRVVKLDGSRMSMTDHVIRWSFRLVDIVLSLGAVAAILISSGSSSQRLGGILSNTVVIKVNPTHSVHLRDLLRIQSLGGYKPQYTGANGFTESEMLLVKDVLDRLRKYPNAVHRQIASTLAAKVAMRLGIGAPPPDVAQFLSVVLKDYVVMTR
jgi:uncharacterized RDD family membrane protein YckC